MSEALRRVPYLYLSSIRLLNTVDTAVNAQSTAETERLPADDGDERDLEPEPSPALKGDTGADSDLKGGAVKKDEMEGRPRSWWGSKGLVWAPRQPRRYVGGL